MYICDGLVLVFRHNFKPRNVSKQLKKNRIHMTFHFNRKLFLYLSLVFILMTIIGTITHELGHNLSAKIMGFNSRVNYGMTILENNQNKSMSNKEYFLFTLGGPIQTMLTGTLGIALLFLTRKSYNQIENLSILQWIMIFMSLFWLRQIANMFTWVLFFFINGKFGVRGDEIKIAQYLELPKWSVLLSTAIIGAFVLWQVIFRFIPEKVRFTFIISGLAGGISGYILWLEIFGKILMP